MEPKKYNKLVNITKRSRLTEKLMVTKGGEKGLGKQRGEDKEVQTTRCKVSYKDILYKMGNVANIL